VTASCLVAGVDCSTQATTVVVVDVASGARVARGTAPHVVTGSDGARETDPAVWLEALRLALTQTGLAGRIEAIAVAGQQHGLVLHDADGRALRPAALWSDTRSAACAEALVQGMGAAWWAERTGSVPVASFTATKWEWLRATDPAAAAEAAGVCLPHDWMNLQLTGEAVTDRGDASGSGWWNSASGRYDPEILDLIELPIELLPRIAATSEPAGVVSAAASALLGLRAGVPVGAGTGDNMAAALGLGLGPGQPVVSLGTSGTAYARMPERAVDAERGLACFADALDGFLPLACTINCTLAVDWFATLLGLDREDVSPSDGVVALPYLAGERTPNLPAATATITGVRASTTSRGILQAVYEGAAYSLVRALDDLAAVGSGLDPEAPIVLVGGGARGTAWRRTLARLSGRSVVVPGAEEAVALGAAAQAAALLTGRDATGHGADLSGARTEVVGPGEADRETLARIEAALGATAGRSDG
jgi:xylulokinase